jgi:hypothetical protein
MRVRTILAAAAAPAAIAAIVLGTAGGAAAQTTQPPHLTGDVVLSGPAQFEHFGNIGKGSNGSLGSVSYTNFTYASPGSGVWMLDLNGGDLHLSAVANGQTFSHTFNMTGFNVTGLNSYTFTASGASDQASDWTWNGTGSVVGNKFTLTATYYGAHAGYTSTSTGTIGTDGSVQGTSTDNTGQSLPFQMPAGSLSEVLSYTAPVSTATITPAAKGGTATFTFNIPATTSLPNVGVTVNVTDGGGGAASDVYMHNGTKYTIIDGNLTVH